MEDEKKNDDIELDFGKITNIFKKKDSTKESKDEKELDVDLSSAFTWLKQNKTIVVWILLFLILGMAFFSRTQNIPNLQNKYLVSPDDPYFFMRMTETIAATGGLPENDTLRYYPDGQATSAENLGMAYVAGYSLKFIQTFNPDANAVTVAAWLPPIFLVIGLFVFFLLTKEIFRKDEIALIATGFLAFSTAIFFRTMSGFLEKEPLFFPLFIISFYFFIKAYKQKDSKMIYVLPALAGIATGFTGFASGLFVFIGIYISLFAIAEVALNKMNKNKFIVLAIWFVFSFITLILLTTKYGRLDIWQNQVFQIPAVGLLFAGISVFVPQPKKAEFIPKGIYHILIGVLIVIIAGCLLFGVSGFADKIGGYTDKILTPSGTDRMSRSVSENQAPSFMDGGRSWWSTFGVMFRIPIIGGVATIGAQFLFFFFGSIVLFYKQFKNFKHKWILTASFVLFMCSLIFENFSSNHKYQWVSIIFGNQLLYTGLFVAVIAAVLFLEKDKLKEFEKIDSIVLFTLIWFVVSTVAANGAVRLFFILALPLMLIAAYFIWWSAEKLKESTGKPILYYLPYVLAALIIITTFSVVTQSNASQNPSYLGVWYEAANWIKENTPEDSVFTSWWDYGYFIQTKAERATVGDPGNFHPTRNYDIGGYVFNSKDNTEVLDFLHKYGNPDYLFIISEDVFKFFQIANLGSLSELRGELAEGETLGKEVYFTTYVVKSNQSVVPNNLGNSEEYPFLVMLDTTSGPAQILEDFRLNDKVYSGETTYLVRYIVPVTENGSDGNAYVQIYDGLTQKSEIYPATCKCEKGIGCEDLNVTGVPVCYLNYDGGVLNIPYKAKDILFVELYILDKDIPGFELVYENNVPLSLNSIHGAGTNIKIYKYDYGELEENPSR